MATKRCSACGLARPFEEFSRDASRPDGLMIRCRECDRARNRAYYARTGRRSQAKARPARMCARCGATATSQRHHYCDACRAVVAAARTRWGKKATHSRTTTARGYGTEHQRRRREIAAVVAAGRAVCVRCSGPIDPDAAWDLDHTDDRTGYMGPAHRKCNRAAGAAKGNSERRRYSEAW